MKHSARATGWRCLATGPVSLAVSLSIAIAAVNGRCAATTAALQPRPGPGIYFVATNGNDAWSGRSPLPNSSKTDGPFATPKGAMSRLRESQPKGRGTNTIILRRGTYFLSEPLVLRPADSSLSFVGYAAEQPTLSGGKRIQGWSEVELNGKKLWAASAAGADGKKWIFRELWTNGKRATRARHPNQGYLAIAELLDPSSDWTKGQSRFRFKAGDVKAWPSAEDAEVVAMSRWVESRLPIASIDESNKLISFSKRSVFELAAGDPYYIEGSLELLDSPGEWYLNPKSGVVYYAPRSGERIRDFEAIAPVLPQLVRIEGNAEKGEFVERLIFRGITFAHAEWYFPDGFDK